ncbi:enolase C-terminal domain-like protein [Phycisphaerales bacterium AB-hyl4]|uniref:Enolase C-terminal domain-like protein n=1 Tax=Natronomicrosphaera hydrolytica TaxID=3242702 RepID=A0ABV4U9M2_9BACT
MDRDAYDALEMIEQPTGRDIETHAFDWSVVAARKPVMVDEGLMTLQSMQVARAQGWSGFALKTCKGHSFALVAAAWAKRHGMQVSLQDLTNPGLSAMHAAIFASRVPTMNGVELNSPQFTPAANAGWLDRYPGLFTIRHGIHQLPAPTTPGLGGEGSAGARTAAPFERNSEKSRSVNP